MTNDIKLEFDLPEFNKEDLKIKIEENFINISGEKKIEKKHEKEGYHSEEKTERTFSYYSNLPPVKADKADIKFENNKLKITIPKK